MTTRNPFQEVSFSARSGWLILLGTLAYWAALVTFGFQIAPVLAFWLPVGGLSLVVTFVFLFGYFIVNPNMSRVLVLFGTYRGTVRTPGFYWNPTAPGDRVARLLTSRTIAPSVASVGITCMDRVSLPRRFFEIC